MSVCVENGNLSICAAFPVVLQHPRAVWVGESGLGSVKALLGPAYAPRHRSGTLGSSNASG